MIKQNGRLCYVPVCPKQHSGGCGGAGGREERVVGALEDVQQRARRRRHLAQDEALADRLTTQLLALDRQRLLVARTRHLAAPAKHTTPVMLILNPVHYMTSK